MGTFKEHDVLIIEPDSKWSFFMGAGRCKIVMDRIQDIRHHVMNHESAADFTTVPPMKLENGKYDPIVLSFYKCLKIIEWQGEIRKFVNGMTNQKGNARQ